VLHDSDAGPGSDVLLVADYREHNDGDVDNGALAAHLRHTLPAQPLSFGEC
jgi:hypothetical protein